MRAQKTGTWPELGILVVLTITVLVFWWVHDAPSYLTDDAIYGMFAEKTLSDFQESGVSGSKITKYSDFVNSLSFWAFGERLVSLRFPLIFVMLALVIGAYRSLLPIDRLDAWIAMAVMLVLTVTQFVNPATSWYAIAIAMIAIVLMQNSNTLCRREALVIGLLVGVCYFLRQPSGAVLGAGVLLASLSKLSKVEKSHECLVARVLICSVFAVLAFMSSKSVTIGSWLLLGLGPAIIAVIFFSQVRVKNSIAFTFSVWFSAGIVLSSAPFLLLHLLRGTLFSWGNSVVVAPMNFDWSSFNPGAAFSIYIVSAIEGVFAKPEWHVFMNAVFWLCLIASPAILSWHMVRQALAGNLLGRSDLTLPLIALFLSVGLLQFQMLVYIFYVSPLCLVAFLVMVRNDSPGVKWGVRAMCVLLVVVGLTAHAGKPFPVTEADYLWGERGEDTVLCPLKRSGLRMPVTECEAQLELSRTIDRFVAQGESILTVPNEIEVNFLSGVDQALPFYNCAMSIGSTEAKDRAVERLQKSLPAMLVVNPSSNYYSELCKELVNAVSSEYEMVDAPPGYEVYVRKAL